MDFRAMLMKRKKPAKKVVVVSVSDWRTDRPTDRPTDLSNVERARSGLKFNPVRGLLFRFPMFKFQLFCPKAEKLHPSILA